MICVSEIVADNKEIVIDYSQEMQGNEAASNKPLVMVVNGATVTSSKEPTIGMGNLSGNVFVI